MENIKIEKTLARLQHASSTDKTRPNLTGVYLNCTEAVATNGHIMAIRKTDKLPQSDDDGRLPKNRIVRFPKRLAKDKHSALYVDDKGINHGNPQNSVEFIDGQFPDYQMAIPKEHKEVVKIALSAELLLQLAKALGAEDKRHVVTLSIAGPESPVFVTGDCPESRGIIMPCRIK